MKFGSAVSEEKSFENVNGRTHGRTDDGRKVITIAHPEQSSGELIRKSALSFLNVTRHLVLFYISTKYHKYSKGYLTYRADAISMHNHCQI